MSKKILIILGHPARKRQSFCESLALACKKSALQAGHEVEFIKVSELSFDPILHEGYWEDQPMEPAIADAQRKMKWAEHWIIVYPLWQFGMPALLKGFFERTIIKGFAYDIKAGLLVKPLEGKTARIVQTMGTPGFFYRWYYREHGEKALKDILSLCGIKSNRSYCSMAENMSQARIKKYFDLIEKLGNLAS